MGELDLVVDRRSVGAPHPIDDPAERMFGAQQVGEGLPGADLDGGVEQPARLAVRERDPAVLVEHDHAFEKRVEDALEVEGHRSACFLGISDRRTLAMGGSRARSRVGTRFADFRTTIESGED